MAIESGTKFLGIASSVDTTERRSKRLNDNQDYHTIEEIVAAANAGIEIPEQVTADTIVAELDAENYIEIESNLQGKLPYEHSIIRIDNFSTSSTASPTFFVWYTNKDGGVPFSGLPSVGFDNTFLTWYIETDTAFSLSYRYTCNVYQYGSGQTNPPALVTAESDSDDSSRILISVYDQSYQQMFAQTTDVHLQFGLQIDVYNFI